MRLYTIHKPTHELRNDNGTLCGTIQLRGNFAMVNMVDGRCEFAVELCARHLTGYGHGTHDASSRRNLENALTYMFGRRSENSRMICRKVPS